MEAWEGIWKKVKQSLEQKRRKLLESMKGRDGQKDTNTDYIEKLRERRWCRKRVKIKKDDALHLNNRLI